MNLDLQAVSSFVTLAHEQHFGRAAKVLNITSPALTKRIQKLERELNVILVDRNSAGVFGLTPAGIRFARIAPTLMKTAEMTRMVAAGQPSLQLRVAMPAGTAAVAPLMPAVLSALEVALRMTFADAAVLYESMPFHKLSDALHRRVVDLVFAAGNSPDPDISCTRLWEVRRVGLVGATHVFANRVSVNVEEFARQPMLYNPELPGEFMNQFILADVRPAAQADLVPVAANNMSMIAQRLMLGKEVTVAPAALTGGIPPQLKRIELLGVPPTWYYAQRRSDDHRPELSTLIDLLSEYSASITALT